MDDGSSKTIQEFLKEYSRKHQLCPKCGSKGNMSTLVGYIVNMNNREDYKDHNICTCSKCSDRHTVHDRISVEDFRNRKIDQII
jgi:hypothetical protein